MNLKTGKKITAAFVLALLLLAGVAGISFYSTMRMTTDARRVEHTHEVMAVIEKLVKIVSYDAVSHRGFLITGDEAFLAKHQRTILDRNAAMEQLKVLVSDNPPQQERFAALSAGIAERENLAKNHVELRRKEGFAAVQKNVASGRGERMLERIYTVALEMSAHERARLNERVRQSESSAHATRSTIAAASMVAFSLVGGALWWLTRELEERRKADAAQRKSEERFRALVTAISDVVYQMNPDWSEMNQLQSQEFLAPSAAGNRNWLQEYIDPDDQPKVMAAIRESIRTKSTFQLEHRVRQADGSVGWTFSRAVPIQDSNGEIVEWFGAASDVTARKRAEQALSARTAELETVMREVPVAIFIGHGADSQIITANPTGRKLLRVADLPNVSMGAPDVGFQIRRNGQPLTPAELPMQQAAATGRDVLDSELEVVFSNGEICRIIGNAVPLFDGNGAVTGSLGTFIDITERKAVEEALKNFNTRLAESVVERTTELRNTVRVLENEIAVRRRLEGEILKLSEREQTRLGQDLHDDLGQQLAGIGMLSQILVSQLQEESHPCAGDAERIAKCLTDSIITTRNLAKSFYPVELERGGLVLALQDLALRTELLSKISCNVTADAEFRFEKTTEIHLYRIVQESINNALKHGGATHVEIDCLRDNGHWMLTVTDNGTGFTAPEPGRETGMGLHIFQYRAALIGAEISVRRGTPGGCVVACSIPIPAA